MYHTSKVVISLYLQGIPTHNTTVNIKGFLLCKKINQEAKNQSEFRSEITPRQNITTDPSISGQSLDNLWKISGRSLEYLPFVKIRYTEVNCFSLVLGGCKVLFLVMVLGGIMNWFCSRVSI